MTIFDSTQSVEARDQMWSELRAAETQRVQWQQQANAAAAQAIGDFHQRAPYADPGVALAAGTASAAGTPSEPIAKAVDQSTADGNRPSWTAQESSGLVNAMRSAAGVPTQGQAHQATLRSIQAYGRANSDPLIRDAQGNVDQAATLKAAGVPQPGGAFNWASPTDYLASAGDNAMTGLKAVTRTGLTVAQSGWQEAQNEAAIATHNVGNVVSDVAAGNLSGAASGLGTIAAMPLHSAESFRATDVVQAVEQQKELGSADLGSGFFPGGTVHNTWQPAAAREVRGVIPGTNSAWTPGRAIAALVDQPGSKQYRILSGVIDGATQFVADPTVLLSDSLLASRAAGQLLEAAPKVLEEAPEAEKALAGAPTAAAVTPEMVQEAAKGVLVNAERPTAIPSRTDQLLQSDAMQPFMSKLADTKDHLEVMQRLGPNAPPSLVSAVTHANTVDDVQAALRNELGLSIRSTDQIPGMKWNYEITRQVKRALPGFDESGDVSARGLQNVPSRSLDGFKWDATPLEQRQTMDTMNSALKTVDVPYETRAKVIGAVSDGFADGSKEGGYKALLGFSDAIKHGYKAGGMNEQLADYLGQVWRDNHTSLYGVDALGRPSDFGFMSTASGAQNLEMISPAKLSEGLGSAVQLPDFRQVRRLTSKFGRLISDTSGDFGTEGQKLKLPLALMQTVAEDVFPRLQVSRIATAVRVIGDEQAKLAAAGLPNFLTHPFQQMALVLGSSTDLERLGVDEHTAQSMLNEASGNLFNADAPEKLLRATRATGSWTDVPFNSPNGVQGGLDMAQQFYHDPISQFVAQGKTTDQIIDWLHGVESPKGEGLALNGAAPGMSGPKAFNEYVKLGANAVARDTTTGRRIAAPVDLTDDNILRGWIDHNIRGQVDDFSKGNTELRNAIGYNKVGPTGANEEVGATPGAAFLSGQTTPEFEQMMRDWSQHPESPERVKWNVRVADRPDAQTIKNMWMKTSGKVMNALFTQPVKMLNRSPLFRGEFYDRVAELAPHLKPTEANNLLRAIEANATDQGFAGKVAEFLGGNNKLDAVIKAAGKANGDLTLDDVFGYAKGHAIDSIHETLFNVEKTNLEQSLRSFTPFVHAWREVLGTWAHLITQNPGIVRKVQMTIQGARDAGWFYTDPVSGEERFNFPGSDWLTHQLMGGAVGDALSHVPLMGQYFGGTAPAGGIPLGGNVKDLNIVSGTFLPGFGPMVQAPAAAILKNIPQADFISGLLTPYGVPSSDNAPFFGKAGAYVLPGWLQKIVSTVSSSPDSASAYGNQYLQMVQQLMASGQYGTSPPEQQRLTRDAQNKAKLLTVLRGLGQFVSPASPSYDPKIAAGPDGADVLMSQLAKEYHTMQSEDYSTATQRFIDTFGEGPFVAAMSRTKSVNGGLDASTEFGNWERDHGGTLQSYPDVGAYFAPIGSDFDSEVYQRQQELGERKKLTGPQIVEAAQSTIAKWKYAQYQKMLGAHPTVAQLNWLTTQKDQLKTQYPGYATDPGNPQDFSTKVEQLKRATTDPGLHGNIQTALATYLYLRDQALGVAQKRAGGKLSATLSSDKDADLRAWLAGQANNIINKYPDFGRMYTNVLSSEVG